MTLAFNQPPDPAWFETVACYHCGETDPQHFLTAQDDLTGKPGDFTFVLCRECGLAYQTPRIMVTEIGRYYDDEYIAHRKETNWGALSWFYQQGMDKHDREKDKLISRYLNLHPESKVLDVGSGSGSFLQRLRHRYQSEVSGVDFKNLTHLPYYEGVKFHEGLFYEQNLPPDHYDLITMWHFLEHDYAPPETLRKAKELVKESGRIVIEVPRLDSRSFQLYGHRWPGLQAPQHTVLFTKATLLSMVENAGLEIIDYLPYGAFPSYFYLFSGLAFKIRKGRGINLRKAIYPYFLGQLLLSPLLLFERRLNLAMQTVVCGRP